MPVAPNLRELPNLPSNITSPSCGYKFLISPRSLKTSPNCAPSLGLLGLLGIPDWTSCNVLLLVLASPDVTEEGKAFTSVLFQIGMELV